jgi:hypothetical protein
MFNLGSAGRTAPRHCVTILRQERKRGKALFRRLKGGVVTGLPMVTSSALDALPPAAQVVTLMIECERGKLVCRGMRIGEQRKIEVGVQSSNRVLPYGDPPRPEVGRRDLRNDALRVKTAPYRQVRLGLTPTGSDRQCHRRCAFFRAPAFSVNIRDCSISWSAATLSSSAALRISAERRRMSANVITRERFVDDLAIADQASSAGDRWLFTLGQPTNCTNSQQKLRGVVRRAL